MDIKEKYSKVVTRLKTLYTNIRKKIPLILKVISFGFVIIVSIPIWLPILAWKMGLILSDNFIKYFIND